MVPNDTLGIMPEDAIPESSSKKPDRFALVSLLVGIFVALLPWGLGMIGVTVNLWLGALVLAVAFGLIVYPLWTWEKFSRWHVVLRISTVVLAAIFYFALIGRQIYAQYQKDHPVTEISEVTITLPTPTPTPSPTPSPTPRQKTSRSISGLPKALVSPKPTPSPQLTTEEIAAAVAKKLNDERPLPIPTPTPTPKPCRGDDLNECSDAGLLEWGKPLYDRVRTIGDQYQKDFEFTAAHYSGDKFFKALEEVNRRTSDEYRDCCAEETLRYYKELTLRLSGGLQNNSFNEWTQRLLKPVGSDDWKSARNEGGEIIQSMAFKLFRLQLDLKLRIDTGKLRN